MGVWSLGLRSEDVGFGVEGLGVKGLGLGFEGLGFRA